MKGASHHIRPGQYYYPLSLTEAETPPTEQEAKWTVFPTLLGTERRIYGQAR